MEKEKCPKCKSRFGLIVTSNFNDEKKQLMCVNGDCDWKINYLEYYNKKKLEELKTEQLLNILPENLIIVKDSGLWNICEDDISMNELYHQGINEHFKDFIIRVLIDSQNDIRYSERIN